MTYRSIIINKLLFSPIAIGTYKYKDCNIKIFPNFHIPDKKKTITVESINNGKFLYLDGNQIFDQNLLIGFEHQLVHSTVSFEGYVNAFNSKIKVIRERENQQMLLSTVDDVNEMLLNEKYFQMVWLLANITKFIFMTTKETCFTILMSVRDIDECTDYFLNIKDDLYKLFVGLWTQHQRFMTSCDQVTRSRVFVVNGHQKANRLVCQYKDVFDSTTSELGIV
ncbi:unnamed protein product [Rotaria magnacalcarata]|uniref:Uncharacterized protein n=1 Tax=Rotaria magnacalcarata TaxID=392030 RepID=A0A816NFH6_9BILA|nr:unnamed protein product [Rotaria magnacalcarata]